MAILSPTNLETANYGTVGWNAIYSSNFQKINDFFKRFDMSRYAITYSSSITYNCSNGNLQSVTLTGNTTISFSNGFAGGKFYLLIKQDATGGRTVSWGSNVRFLTGVSNQVDLNANAVTILGFVYNDIDVKYDCFLNSYGLSANEILNRLLTVDGSGSGLDADTVDNYHASQTPTENTIVVSKSDKTIDDKWLPSTVARKTVSAVTIYVDNVNGSDTTGDGSSGNPYATFNRAMQDVGEFYSANVTIVLKKSATSYGTLNVVGRIRQNTFSTLTIQGEMDVLDSGSISSFSNSVNDPVYGSSVTVARITDSTKNWTTDQYKHKLLRVYKDTTSYYRIITNNDATNLYCSYTFPVTIDNTWSYEILDWGTRCNSIYLYDCMGQVTFSMLHVEPVSNTFNVVARNSKYANTFSYCRFKPFGSQTSSVLLCNYADVNVTACLFDMSSIGAYAIQVDKSFNAVTLTGVIFDGLQASAIHINFAPSRIYSTDGVRFYRGTSNPSIGLNFISGLLVVTSSYGKTVVDAGTTGILLTRGAVIQNSSNLVFGSSVTTPISSYLGLVDGAKLLVFDYFGVNITNNDYTNLHSRLQIAGSIATQVTTVTANTTLGADHHIVLVNASGGNRTITLPDATTCGGRQYIVKKIDSSSNTVTISAQSGQTIDGQASVALNTQYQRIGVVSNGSNWFIIE